MAFNEETPTWVEGIYQLEEADSPVGGRTGTTNKQFIGLACRTSYLHELLKNLYAASVSGRTITSWEVGNTIAAETEVLLPVKYLVGAHALMLFCDATGEIGPKYYREQGVAGLLSDKVTFVFDIPAGSILTAVTLATTVESVEYDTVYVYKEAYTEKYSIRAAKNVFALRDVRYKTSDQHVIALDDSQLNVGHFIEDADTYDLAKVDGGIANIAVTARFRDTDAVYDEMALQVIKDGKIMSDDIAMVDNFAVKKQYFTKQIDVFFYEDLEVADEELDVKVYRNFTRWIDDADFTDTYDAEINDDSLIVAKVKDGSKWEGVYIADDYSFHMNEGLWELRYEHTPMSDAVDSEDNVLCTVNTVDKDIMPDNNSTLSCNAMLNASDKFNGAADDWSITVSDAKNS